MPASFRQEFPPPVAAGSNRTTSINGRTAAILRERQQQFDIEHMRKQLDQQEFDRKYNHRPC